MQYVTRLVAVHWVYSRMGRQTPPKWREESLREDDYGS